MQIQENVPLTPHTTFGIGGPAEYYVAVEKKGDVGPALDYAQTRDIPYFILSGGSNVLVSDAGMSGLVIHIQFGAIAVDTANAQCTAQAGANLQSVIDQLCNVGLSGMEAMYGIPGSVGGAVRGNAGAFGTEILDVCTSVEALNVDTREIRTFAKEDCYFGYRTSFFKQNAEWVVLEATFTLQKAHVADCVARAQHTLAERNIRQIQDIRSAGSFFMNPRVPEPVQQQFQAEKGVEARGGRVPAGWLIEKAGLKGVCEKSACTGERSANYVINTDGSATAKDVRTLTGRIKDEVEARMGVHLQEEVTLIGF